MLRAITRRPALAGVSPCRRGFASASHAGWAKRQQDLEKSYPGLFGANFTKNQSDFLSAAHTKDSVAKLLATYDQSRQQVAKASGGEEILITIDADSVLSPTPVLTASKTSKAAEASLAEGEKLVSKTMELQALKASSLEEQHLNMADVAEYGDKLRDWLLTLDDGEPPEIDRLPLTDAELQAWVDYECYQNAPKSADQEAEREWMEQLDGKLRVALKAKDPKLDEGRLTKFLASANEMFDPRDISHYSLADEAKVLFRAALWQSDKALANVEASVKQLEATYESGQDDDAAVMRIMFETDPASPLGKVVALQLQILDPLFAARLCDEARAQMEKTSFDRAVKDVLRPLEMPMIESDIVEAQAGANPQVVAREVSLLEEEKRTFDVTVPGLEAVLDNMLKTKLWGKDPKAVKGAIVAFATGKGKLDAVHKAIQAALAPGPESTGLSADDILAMSIKYHNARYSNRHNWNLRDFLVDANTRRDTESVIEACRHVRERLSAQGIDPLAVEMVTDLIEEGTCLRLPTVLEDYCTLMKKYRGEVDGLLTTAQEFSAEDCTKVQKAYEAANPGKKLTLTQQVDPSLKAGFVLKAGVDRFDMSLARHISEGRKDT